MRLMRAMIVSSALAIVACLPKPQYHSAADIPPARNSGVGLDIESIVWIEITKDGRPPGEPFVIGYRTRYAERDSIAFRRDLERRLGREGYDRRAVGDPSATVYWRLVIPCYRDAPSRCESSRANRESGLLFAPRNR